MQCALALVALRCRCASLSIGVGGVCGVFLHVVFVVLVFMGILMA